MSFDRSVRYPTKWLPPSLSFPFGVPKNSTTETSKDGVPFEKDYISDTEGFFQGMLSRRNITLSGNPDTALISDYLDALGFLVGITHATIAVAIADTTLKAGMLITTLDNNSSVRGGGGNYIMKTDAQAIADGDFVTVPDGSGDHASAVAGLNLILQPVNDVVTSAQYGEDLTALFAALPRKVRLSPITYNRTETIDILSPCDIDLNGAEIIVLSDTTYQSGFDVKSNNVSIYNGSVDVSDTDNNYAGQEGARGSCITVGKQDTLTTVSDWDFHDLTLDSSRQNGGGAVTVWSGARRGKIDNINFPGNTNQVGALINIEWGGNGVDESRHPNNIEITNITANNYPNMAAFAAVVRVSGGYNITVDGVDAFDVSSLFSAVAGDFAELRAPAFQVGKVLRGISASNLSGVDVHGDALSFTSKAGLSADFLLSQITVDNISAIAKTGTTDLGVNATNCYGSVVKNFTFSGFRGGYNLSGSGERNVLRDGTIDDCTNFAANFAETGGLTLDNNLVDNVKMFDINKALTGGAGGSAIQINSGSNTTVKNCTLGEDGEIETAAYHVFVSSNASLAKVHNNHTYDTASGDDMNVSAGATGDENHLIVNNTAPPGMHGIGGVSFIEIGANRTQEGITSPAVGTYIVGDTLIKKDPVIDGNNMVIDRWRCTVAGTPGTWTPMRMSTVSPAN